MKNPVARLGLLACLLLLLTASATRAKDLGKPPELSSLCQRIYKYLPLSLETPAEQRAQLALSIAIAQSESVDVSNDLVEVLRHMNKLTTYLVMSDTFYLWDTDHWVGDHRSTYTYSGSSLTSEVEQTWNGASWENTTRTLISYNGEGTRNTVTEQYWVTDNWENLNLITFGYSGGLMDTVLVRAWSGSAWVNYSRTTVTYSGAYLATTIIELWQTGAWINFSRSSYTFSGGNLTAWIVQSWASVAWIYTARTTYTYDGNGWMTEDILYRWQGSLWVTDSKHHHSYDGLGNEILDLSSNWTGASWVAVEADTLKWSGGRNTEIVYNQISSGSVFREQFTYDVNGNKTIELGQDWSGSEWVNSDQAVYVFQAVFETPCGDFDVSGDVDIADAVLMVNYIFGGGPAPADLRHGDVDCDLEPSIADAVYLVLYIFSGGLAPCATCP
jgi:hypothetical protein